jgi:hypothetical protein
MLIFMGSMKVQLHTLRKDQLDFPTMEEPLVHIGWQTWVGPRVAIFL